MRDYSDNYKNKNVSLSKCNNQLIWIWSPDKRVGGWGGCIDQVVGWPIFIAHLYIQAAGITLSGISQAGGVVVMVEGFLLCAVWARPPGGSLPWRSHHSAWCSHCHLTLHWPHHWPQHELDEVSWSCSPASEGKRKDSLNLDTFEKKVLPTRLFPESVIHLTCVAQTMGLPILLHLPVIIFWAMKTFSVGISMPRSPRATMMPSLASRISSNLAESRNFFYFFLYFYRDSDLWSFRCDLRESIHLRTPSWFSSLLMILMSLPFSPSTFLTAWTSAALRMKEAKTMSTPCSTPNCRSFMSFSDTAGRSTAAPGRLTPFLLPRTPPFSMRHTK